MTAERAAKSATSAIGSGSATALDHCPCCGASALLTNPSQNVLLAVCSVLVVKALEHMGKWIVRSERSRFRTLGNRPFYIAHTLWQPDDVVVSKALRGAWDVVPAMLDTHGCCGATSVKVIAMLDSYVHDLVITGTEHSIDELAYRFEQHLGLDLATERMHA